MRWPTNFSIYPTSPISGVFPVGDWMNKWNEKKTHLTNSMRIFMPVPSLENIFTFFTPNRHFSFDFSMSQLISSPSGTTCPLKSSRPKTPIIIIIGFESGQLWWTIALFCDKTHHSLTWSWIIKLTKCIRFWQSLQHCRNWIPVLDYMNPVEVWFISMSYKCAIVEKDCSGSKTMRGWRNKLRCAEIKWQSVDSTCKMMYLSKHILNDTNDSAAIMSPGKPFQCPTTPFLKMSPATWLKAVSRQA